MSRRLEDDAVEWTVGRYTIYGELASGGMATVHIGRMSGAVGFSRLVAIKQMHPQFLRDPDFLEMFLDEARLAARIRHPNVVQVLDVISEDDEVLLVMEYIHGDALSRLERAVAQRREAVPPRVAAAISAGALHGLHAAHEAKGEDGAPLHIIHRDVSPQNIIVCTDGVARIIDFGIAKAANQVHFTQEGELKGKLVYMAPEQLVDGSELTRQVDIYSMAVTAWELFTGQRMFDTSDTRKIMAARSGELRVAPPSSIVPELPKALDEVILRGLAADTERRWKTAREMAEALEEAVHPATAAQVGAWVRDAAKFTLEERQARIDDIEQRVARGKQSARDVARSLSEAPEPLLTKDIVVAAPPLPPARRASLPPSQERRASTAPPARPTPPPAAPPPERPTLPPPAAPSKRPPLAPSLLAPISADPFAVPGAPPPPSASLSLEAPAIPTELAKPAKVTIYREPSRRGGLVAAIVIVLAVFGIAIYLPSFLKKAYVEAAAAHGFTLVVTEVDPFAHLGSVELVDATLTSSELPGVSAHADKVHIELDGLQPRSITAKDATFTLDASFASLRSALDRFSDKHPEQTAFGLPETVTHVRVEPAHIVWTQPAGSGTQLDARSVVVDVSRVGGRKLGLDWTVSNAPVLLSTPLGPMGPWVVSAQQSDKGLKARISFDQKAQQNAGLDVTVVGDKTSVDMHASHASPDELSIKGLVWNAHDDELRVDLALHATLVGDKLDASLDARVEGWRADQGPAAVLILTGEAHGDRKQPVSISGGLVALGAASAPFSGSVQLQPDGVLVRGSGAPSLKCDGGQLSEQLRLLLDTRDVGKSGLGLSRGCARGRP